MLHYEKCDIADPDDAPIQLQFRQRKSESPLIHDREFGAFSPVAYIFLCLLIRDILFYTRYFSKRLQYNGTDIGE